MFQRFLWKLLPKTQRSFLLDRLSVVDRQVVNKVMSGDVKFPVSFKARSCLFIHVPKCAGSSICSALFDGWGPGHLPLYWYEQQFPEQFAKSFKFAFVRDPLERAYSAYSYLKASNETYRRDLPAKALVDSYRDFDDLVHRWLDPDNVQRQLHFAPQAEFITGSLGHMALDFIGRQENIANDFRTVCEALGVDPCLPHLNDSTLRNPAPARDFCTVRTRRLVRRVYQRDYELLGYE